MSFLELLRDGAHPGINEHLRYDHQWQREEQPGVHLEIVEERYLRAARQATAEDGERQQWQPRQCRDHSGSPAQLAERRLDQPPAQPQLVQWPAQYQREIIGLLSRRS